MEGGYVVVPRLDALLDGQRLPELEVEVPVVQLAVQHQEHLLRNRALGLGAWELRVQFLSRGLRFA